MSYRIDQDDTSRRERCRDYAYRIYEGDRLIARYWHDYRGDEHGIEFVDGTGGEQPVGRMIDIIEGGDPQRLTLTDETVAYLQNRRSSSHNS